MVSIREVPTDKLIETAASKLKSMPEFKPPVYVNFVKTGVSRERMPMQKDWWWIRAAAVLRKIYLHQNLGVGKLRKLYGGRKRRGHKPEHKYPASGAIIRKILQQLELAGFVKSEKGKGRSITLEGKKFLKSTAQSIK